MRAARRDRPGAPAHGRGGGRDRRRRLRALGGQRRDAARRQRMPACLEVRDRCDERHAAAPEVGDVAGEPLLAGRIATCEEHGSPSTGQAQQAGALMRLERAERLVKEQHLRIADQGRGEAGPLHEGRATATDGSVDCLGRNARPRQRALNARRHLGRRNLEQPGREGQRLTRRHPTMDARLGPEVRDAARPAGHRCVAEPGDLDAPARRPAQPRQYAKQARGARLGLGHDEEPHAHRHGEGASVERAAPAEVSARHRSRPQEPDGWRPPQGVGGRAGQRRTSSSTAIWPAAGRC
jgi:hypothetical protein